jgi:hypothetical protein
MSVKIIDVPRMGYSTCKAKGFESYEISVRASLFAPMDYFTDLRACTIVS